MTRLITADTHTLEDDDKVDSLGLDWGGGEGTHGGRPGPGKQMGGRGQERRSR